MTFIDIRGQHVHEPEATEPAPLVTQRDLAKRFGVSQRRVQVVELKALKKFVAGCERRAKRAGVSLVDWLLCEGA